MSAIPWQSFWISLALSALLTPMVIELAHRLGFVDRPREDRWSAHFVAARRPPALMGGVGIYLTLAIGAALLLHWNRQMLGIAVGATLMFAAGLVDDVRGLPPHLKMVSQAAAAGILLATGTTFTQVPVPWLAAAATVFWVIAITNAVNLIDNMDGLAGGVVMVSALAMAACGLRQGLSAPTTLALLIAGSCGGFLIYNFKPAKLFMGDCGTMPLGFLMSAMALAATPRIASNMAVSLFVPVALLAVPIFDTTLVSVVRRLNGRPISRGGCDHSSHRLVALGLTERKTVCLLYGISVAFGLLAIATAQLTPGVALILAALMCSALVWFGAVLGMIRIYDATCLEVKTRRVVLVGADATGLAAMRELQRNGSRTVPVAFLGDDETRQQHTMSGVPVLGSVEELPAMVRRLDADAVVIAVDDHSKQGEAALLAQRVAALCDAHAIPHQRWAGLLTESS